MRYAVTIVSAFAASAVGAAEIPRTSFYSGNDVHGLCQHDRSSAFAYVAGLYDEAAHAALIVDGFRVPNRSPQNDALVEFALNRIVGYCAPTHATLEQVTDVFCKYLREAPAEQDGLPAILFSQDLTKAWPCPGK